jgi:16S rRNA (cytidine1402-2'-O)-methyltransferase
VEAVPGPCALVAALTASGLATDEFHFVGFLPHKSGQRRKQLEELKEIKGTLVLYESPYRVEKLLTELNEIYPERLVVLARELTKKFEEFLRGTAAQLLAQVQKRSLKGEFVVLVDAKTETGRPRGSEVAERCRDGNRGIHPTVEKTEGRSSRSDD